ncbi:hypothetical protein TNCV_494361 [Trichonephila clavipes]|nr:hypothetical protein TNCV_494361 [Trichonephila clavipes]
MEVNSCNMLKASVLYSSGSQTPARGSNGHRAGGCVLSSKPQRRHISIPSRKIACFPTCHVHISKHRIFDRCPGQYAPQISHPLKTFSNESNGNGLLVMEIPPLPVTSINNVWHKLETLWSDLTVSVTQTQFNPIPRRIRVILGF